MSPESDDPFFDSKAVITAMQQAVKRAFWVHHRLGYPIAVWRDGKVVWIPADKIPEEVPDIESYSRPTM